MDATDRKFWIFYTNNWCPGRCVLPETNLWLKDFARMHKSDGVRAAIQSLAGIYIYDYLPVDDVKIRVNQRFSEAESCYSQLLADPGTAQNPVRAGEAITIAAILSMQDIVLTERRLKGLRDPRWLLGFQQAELFLQATDQGLRFWKPEAWRLAAIVYLQYRVLRLPRNHASVVLTLKDLAMCVKLMPTSGFHFTAQAPLFPVFLLGMLATSQDHRMVSNTWFDEVVSTPVRSSVPPLYQSLQRIWLWMDVDIEPSPTWFVDAMPIGRRTSWWERLVDQVYKREKELLCLT
ncbi:zinc finger-like protein [Purpureocillium lavendulum]|uniref:Zinc finger-like protein n=1 Tax=Purpureocillium lavendulum TaxID=1247861 RepID=A0AB34FBZ7_9HYPO|nr:zinc finger-like protein [Purpureocillium lavendulum]